MGMEGVDVFESTPEWARRGGWSREAQDYIDKKAAQAATANSAAAEAAVGTTSPPSTPRDMRSLLREGIKDAGRAAGTPGVAGAALGAGTAIASAYNSFSRPTDDYLRRFGMDQNNFGGAGGVGARALGVAGDFGAALLDTPVDTVNLAARLLGGKGDFRLPGGSFTEKLQERDKPPGGAPQKPEAPIVGSIPQPSTPSTQTTPTPSTPQTPDAMREAARFAEQARQSSLPLRDQGPAGAAPAPGGITVTRGANGALEFSGANVRGAPSYIGEGAELMAGLRGGGVSPQNMQAAQNLSDRDQLAARASALRSLGDPGPQYQGPQYREPRHSGNDWQARNDLRNLEVSASSFTASPEAKAAYAQALGLDQMKRAGADPGTLARIQAGASNYGHDQSLRGQMYAADQGLRGHMFTADANQRGAMAQMLYNLFKDNRQFALEEEKHNQVVGHNAEENTRKGLQVFTPEGKPDDGKSAARFNVANQLFPGFSQMTEATRAKAAPDVNEILGIFDKVYDQKQMGFDKLNPFEPRKPALSSLPQFHKGKLERAGADAWVTPGISRHDYFVTDKAGVAHPLGNLTARQIDLIEHNIKTGRWDAPINTQRGG